MYNDGYATCSATYATLCILGLNPDGVTRRLGLPPTDCFVRGDVRHGAPMRHDGWFLTSKDAVSSNDAVATSTGSSISWQRSGTS